MATRANPQAGIMFGAKISRLKDLKYELENKVNVTEKYTKDSLREFKTDA
jgi:hypothetical protein